MMTKPWSSDLDTLFRNFGVDQQRGLLQVQVKSIHDKFGQNRIYSGKKISFVSILIHQFNNPIVYLLLASFFFAYIMGNFYDSIAILAIVVMNGLVGFIQEYKAENSLAALNRMTLPRGRVLREGRVYEVFASEVVPGDILVFEAGDLVLADSRLIEADQLSADESILTGESLPVDKVTSSIPENSPLPERTNMIFMGTAISSGSGRAIVTGVGDQTELGKIASFLKTSPKDSTPLELKLEKISNVLLYVGLIIIILTVSVGYLQNKAWNEILLSAISLAIAAIPEGLPTVVTIALVVAVYRMSKKKALIRKLDAVETLGSTDVICSDKTGTLTTGKLTVRDLYFQDKSSDKLFLGMILCNNASLQSGDPTEVALLEKVSRTHLDIQKIRGLYPRKRLWSFDSKRKLMSVLVDDSGEFSVYTKGAPESVFSLCEMPLEEKEKLYRKVDEHSSKGMRVLAFAHKKIDSDPGLDLAQIETKLIFSGLVAMADSPRVEAVASIEKCHKAGIKVVMITGDHPKTAESIATELGIKTKESPLVVTGIELDSITNEKLINKLDSISVYARVSPEHKLRLVNAFKNKGKVVAMTGDGVNDAPALKFASIGIAMGKGGTEVARQASSMILTDDNFASIVDAIEEGRAIHGNIRRTLQYLLSHNLAELLFIFGVTLTGFPAPLYPLNLLWLNLVTDGIPALALASEKVPKDFLENSHKPTGKTFLDGKFYSEMCIIGIIITIMYYAVYLIALNRFDTITARSLIFSFMVYVGLFRSLSCRSDRLTFFEMKMNWPLLFSVTIPLIFQLCIQISPTLLTFFNVRALSWEENVVLFILAPLPVTIIEVYKLISRRYL